MSWLRLKDLAQSHRMKYGRWKLFFFETIEVTGFLYYVVQLFLVKFSIKFY
jgi:hypothetical protein